VHEQHVTCSDGRHQRDLDRAALAVRAVAQGKLAIVIDGDHRARIGYIAARDAVLRPAGDVRCRRRAHSITLAFSSSSSCS
jgi:hypothetical protein